MSTNASAFCANGTKSSRLTTDNKRSTSASNTFQGRICCLIMLLRASSKFILVLQEGLNRFCKILPGGACIRVRMGTQTATQPLRQVIHIAIDHRHHDQGQPVSYTHLTLPTNREV